MNDLLYPEVLTAESTDQAERIECVGLCHNGPIDDSPKALRYAAEHDPDAPAAFLLVNPCCDTQLALCAKKIDSLLEWALIGSGMMKCNKCGKKCPINDAAVIPLNQG